MVFLAPDQVNQRRHEALRAYYVEGLTLAAAGKLFGYTRWAMVDLTRQHRAGTLALFADFAAVPVRADTATAGLLLAVPDLLAAIFDLDFHAVVHWGHDPVLESTTYRRAPSVPAAC